MSLNKLSTEGTLDPNDDLDTDGDGTPDDEDAFPNDPNEQKDTDGDGVGDNGDRAPNDPDIPFPRDIDPGGGLVPTKDILKYIDHFPLDDNWTKHVILERENVNSNWTTIRIWYTDSNDIEYDEYPLNDKETEIDTKTEKIL